MTVPLRAALYLRVSTARQPFLTRSVRAKPIAPHADTGSSKPMSSRELRLSATNGRHPEFQRMIETGTSKPASFDVVIAKKERVVGLKATRDQAQADAERAKSCSKAQARANRRLHPRWSASSPGRRVNGYGSKEAATGATISHRALASVSRLRTKRPSPWDRKAPAADAGRCVRRKAGYVRRSQFCSEVADPARFELAALPSE